MKHALDRWHVLKDHAEQSRLWSSPARHRTLAAGRGSGKTESAARIILGGDRHHRGAFFPPPHVHDPLFVVAAPTRDQVKSIWWDKIKSMIPRSLMARDPLETELMVILRNGARLRLVGLDKPQRVEGIAIDGLVVDEYAEVRADAWQSSLEPALNRLDRPGWALFIGRPRGRNHFYEQWRGAKTWDEWDSFHWTSSQVMEAAVLERLKQTTDPLTYRQEYLADWINFVGLAYYQWDANRNLRKLAYNPDLPLVFCFDFNVDPGVAVVLQDQPALEGATCIIGEVHIPRNSNTPAVCRRLADDWGHHTGEVHLYGDATGTQRRTSATEGNDWELIRQHLRPTFSDLRMRVPKANPHERERINSVNTRLCNAAGKVRLLVDPDKAPNVVRDFEGVCVLEGGSGEIDKKSTPELTHMTDAIGYYIHARHPLGGHVTRIG